MTYEGLTERECYAIRGAYTGLLPFEYLMHDMTIRIENGADGVIVAPDQYADYVNEWRRSGLWSLPGRASDGNPEGGDSATGSVAKP